MPGIPTSRGTNSPRNANIPNRHHLPATRTLQAKAANPSANTSADGADSDQLVYELYGLTDVETAAVVGR